MASDLQNKSNEELLDLINDLLQLKLGSEFPRFVQDSGRLGFIMPNGRMLDFEMPNARTVQSPRARENPQLPPKDRLLLLAFAGQMLLPLSQRPRRQIFFTDFQKLVDVNQRKKENPEMVVPGNKDLVNIRLHSFVKICFEQEEFSQVIGERFWVQITHKEIGGGLVGRIVTDLVFRLIPPVKGDIIRFERRHVFDIQSA